MALSLDKINVYQGYVQRMLPATFDEAVSYLEILQACIEEIKKTNLNITTVNDGIIALETAVNNKLAEFDSIVATGILSILSQWKTNGTLSEFINALLFTNKEDKTAPKTGIGFNRIFRHIIKNPSSDSEVVYGFPQGLLFDKANNTLISTFTPMSAGSGNNNNVNIKKFDMSGNVIGGYEQPLYHANGIKILDKENRIGITAPCNQWVDGELLQMKDLITFNLDTFETITHYEHIPEVDTDYIRSVCCDNDGNIYAMNSFGTALYVFKIVNSLLTYQRKITLNYGTQKTGISAQSIEWHDGYFYMTKVRPNSVCVFDENGIITKNYSIPKVINARYEVGEVEDITFVDGTRFIISSAIYPNTEKEYTVTQFIEFDINSGVMSADPLDFTAHTQTLIPNIYVGAPTTNNPSGALSNPFSSIQEAVNAVSYGNFNSVRIRINKAAVYEKLIINGISCGLVIENISGGIAEITGLNIDSSSAVTIDGFSITGECTNSNAPVSVTNNANVTFKDCSINSNCDYGIRVFNSVCKTQRVTISGASVKSYQVANCGKLEQISSADNSDVKIESGNVKVFPNRIPICDTFLDWDDESANLLTPVNYFNSLIVELHYDTKTEWRIIPAVSASHQLNIVNISNTGVTREIYHIEYGFSINATTNTILFNYITVTDKSGEITNTVSDVYIGKVYGIL